MPPSVAGDYTRWSDCSIEDFTKMVNQKPTCLKEIDPSNPPIEIEKQPLEPRECNMNKQYPGLNGFANFNYFGKDHFYTKFVFQNWQNINFSILDIAILDSQHLGT